MTENKKVLVAEDSSVIINLTKNVLLFEKYKITHIDFFSLDIEGYELNILKTIDFEKINIIFFTIEYILRIITIKKPINYVFQFCQE